MKGHVHINKLSVDYCTTLTNLLYTGRVLLPVQQNLHRDHLDQVLTPDQLKIVQKTSKMGELPRVHISIQWQKPITKNVKLIWFGKQPSLYPYLLLSAGFSASQTQLSWEQVSSIGDGIRRVDIAAFHSVVSTTANSYPEAVQILKY